MLDAENQPADSSAETIETAAEAPETKGRDDTPADGTAEADAAPAKKAAARRTAAKKATAKKAAAKKTAAKRTTRSSTEETSEPGSAPDPEPTGASVGSEGEVVTGPEQAGAPTGEVAAVTGDAEQPVKKTAKKAAKKAPAKRAARKSTTKVEAAPGDVGQAATDEGGTGPSEGPAETGEAEQAAEAAPGGKASPVAATALLFQPPDSTKAVVTTRRRRSSKAETAEGDQRQASGDATVEAAEGEVPPKPAKKAAKKTAKKPAKQAKQATPEEAAAEPEPEEPAGGAAEDAGPETAGAQGEEDQGGERRRRRRGGRRRRRSGGGEDSESADAAEETTAPGDEGTAQSGAEEAAESGTPGTRRRRRRRRAGEADGGEEPEGSVTRVRRPRNAEDEITALTGSTRLEAKKQRRREGREAGRRRAPIVSEAEFLARRESVDRVMVIRQRKDLTQIAVLEDKVLVEHYVARESQTSLIGNVYLGRVQNVLPSMEAAFIDIGKGRNAVLYAGEVNWDALGAKNGQPRKIEAVLKSGQPILVQVTKDPVGHKGARLTSQISLPGRFLVYVPDGTTSGISRKLPDTERNRLKNLLKDIVPDTAGVIVRTAAEGASEEELTRDVERLTARWADIESKAGGTAPQLLYGEPDLTLKVVRDLFTEDFSKLVIAGGDAWDMVDGYVSHVAPDLADRLEKYDGARDVFAEYRIDEQIEKALDRKVWLPSGGSLVIDRTEAMTVVDVNTGKFTGSGGNLEETVTKNNLEAAEEIVRQLRLRDIGGIIVVDFIDMVLESNRDLVLRRLVECLGRDRTRHQVAEVTSLGLVQMTRKRIGTGLLEAFSEACDHCQGRGLILHHEPIEPKKKAEDDSRRGRRGGRGRGRDEAASGGNGGGVPSPKDIAAMAKPEDKGEGEAGEQSDEVAAGKREDAGPGEKDTEVAGAEVDSADNGRAVRGGRGRGGRGRGAKQAPAEEVAEASTGGEAASSEQAPGEAPAETVEAARETGDETAEAPKEAEETSDETPPAEATAPAPPKIVTSVRRRGARRAAGPPPGVVDSTPPAGTSGSATGGDGTSDEGTDEPADVDPLAAVVDDAELDASGPEAVDDEGVGTADGAGARAGALDGVTPSANGAEATEPTADGADLDGEDPADGAPATPHVPVKKRGSRRR